MKKAVFWLGSITALLSIVGIYFCAIISEVFPKAVYALFKVFGGSYSPNASKLDFSTLYLLCAMFFIVGIGASVWAYVSEKKNG